MATSKWYFSTSKYRFTDLSWWNVLEFWSNKIWRSNSHVSIFWRSISKCFSSTDFGIWETYKFQRLKTVLNELLTDKHYLLKAKEISAIFGDNVVHRMNEFIWWIEHVIKFRGVKHLKSHAAEMSIITYLLLDVLLVNLLILICVLFGIYYVIRLCLQNKTVCVRTRKNKISLKTWENNN